MADEITKGMNLTTTNTDARQNYLTRKLLQRVKDSLQMAPLCTHYPMPKNAGSLTIRMFKRAKAEAGTVKELTEGKPDDNWSRTDIKGIDVALKQYGEKSKISDVAGETDLFNQLEIESERMGEACALFVDHLIMKEAVYSTKQKFYTGAADFNALKSAAGGPNTVINCARILFIAQILAKQLTPKFDGGYYVGVLTPEQIYDLQQDPDWKNLNVHNRGGKAIYKNEIGEIYGVKILQTTAGIVEKNSPNGDIYHAVFMGKGAIGISDITGARSAKSPSFIHVKGADKSDPLDQYQTIGWKGYFGQKLLEPEWLVTVCTKTQMPSLAAPASEAA